MYIRNGSSGMATLLQPKNCMKTLVNGGVSSGGTTSSTSTGPSLSSTANGSANNLNTTNPSTTIQQTRMLLPHEMIGVPIGNVSVSSNRQYHHTNIGNTQGAFVFNGYQSQQQQQQQQQQQLQNQQQTQQQLPINNHFHHHSQSQQQIISTSSNSQNQHQNQNMFGHNSLQYTSTTVIASGTPSSTGSVTAANSGTTNNNNLPTTTATQQTRYFSQFSNTNNQNTSNNNIVYSNVNNRNNNSSIFVSNNHQNHPQSHQNSHGTTIVTTTAPTTPTTTSNNILKRDADGATVFRGHNLPPNSLNNVSVIATSSSSSQQQHNHTHYGNSSSLSLVNQIKEENLSQDGQLVKGNNCSEQQQQQTTISHLAGDGTNKLPNGSDCVIEKVEEQESEPEIDIVINNVVCSFSVRCHLNLREIALNGFNVEYRRENGMVTMKLRRPYTTASIWSSGRITCTGATSEEQAKIAARRYARCLQTLGFRVRFNNFRVVNVLGTCSMPWAIKIVNFSEKYKKDASYEPELHPGVTYKLKSPKATLKIFSTGSITVTAASVCNVQYAIEHIFPLVFEFRKKRTNEEMEILRAKQQHAAHLAEQAELEEALLHSKVKRARMEKDNACVILPPNFNPDDLIEGPDDEDDY